MATSTGMTGKYPQFNWGNLYAFSTDPRSLCDSWENSAITRGFHLSVRARARCCLGGLIGEPIRDVELIFTDGIALTHNMGGGHNPFAAIDIDLWGLRSRSVRGDRPHAESTFQILQPNACIVGRHHRDHADRTPDQLHGFGFAPHLMTEMNVHVAAATTSTSHLEHFPFLEPFITEPLKLDDGRAFVPDTLGNGSASPPRR